jgi:hypothetical protein
MRSLAAVEALDVGDRLIFLTDGMLERDAAGMDIAAILTAGIDMQAALPATAIRLRGANREGRADPAPRPDVRPSRR